MQFASRLLLVALGLALAGLAAWAGVNWHYASFPTPSAAPVVSLFVAVPLAIVGGVGSLMAFMALLIIVTEP